MASCAGNQFAKKAVLVITVNAFKLKQIKAEKKHTSTTLSKFDKQPNNNNAILNKGKSHLKTRKQDLERNQSFFKKKKTCSNIDQKAFW